MIEIFAPSNENYSVNGDMVLEPSVCDIEVDMTSAWPLTLEHPIDRLGRWKFIVEDSVLRVPSHNGDQLFRIKKVRKSDNGVVANALPIWFDASNEVFILDTRPTKKTGQEALNDILRGQTKYTGTSDITRLNTAYYVLKNAVEAITGSDNSFLSRWGGEILYDNYNIIINNRIGLDNGVELLYGKNVPVNGFVETIDISNVVTRIIPKAYNGRILPGSNPFVDSPLIDNYPIIRTSVIEYDNIRLAEDNQSEDTDGLIICQTLNQLYSELRNAASLEYEKGIDKPDISITCEMTLLQNTEEYKRFQSLETVGLGDTVYCRHYKLGITTEARVVALTWDCLTKTVRQVTIGETKPTFMDRVANSVSSTEKALTKNGTVLANQIEGVINMGSAQLKYQQDIAKRQDIRAMMFEDFDPNSPMYGAMAQGTQGFQISKQRNAENNDWVWTTAVTAAGIVADAITVGTLRAVDIEGVTITGSTINGNEIYGGTISGTSISGGSLVVQGPDDDDPTLYDDRLTIQDGYIEITTVYKGSEITPPKIISSRKDAKKISFSGQISNTVYRADYGYDGIMLYTSGNMGRERTFVQSPQIYATRMISGQDTEVWKNIFIAQDSFSPGTSFYAGFITNSSKAIDFFVPLPSSAVGLSVNISSLPTNLSVRGTQGYINGKQYLTDADIDDSNITITVRRGGLQIRMPSAGTSYTNCSNNTPVTVAGAFTFNFY